MIGLRDVLVVAPAASFHPQHHHHHHNDATTALLSPAEHPIIPLLTATPCLVDDSDSGAGRGRIPAGINLWQNQPAQQPAAWAQQNPFPSNAGPSSSSYLCKPTPTPTPVLDSASATNAAAGVLGGSAGGKGAGIGGLMTVGVVGGGEIGVGDGMSSPMTCQDCGNKAKKDCVHRRCRSCCKSRGFDCSTHVKSTWVPAAQRRERQMSSSVGAPVFGGAAVGGAGPGSSASTSATKKPRLVSSNEHAATATGTTNTTSTSNNTTPPRSFETSSSHQDACFRQSLPRQLTAPAVFKCVKVTTMDDGEDEYAYHAVVRIGGHIFKGFLYDQGAAEETLGAANTSGRDAPGRGGNGGCHNNNDGGGGRDHSNRTSGIPNISELHLGGAAGGVGPSDLYAAGLGGGLMGGTGYGNPMN